MKRERKMRNALVFFTVLSGLLLSAIANAGSLDPSAAPASTMRTLEELKPAWDKIITTNRFVPALDGTSAYLDKETGLVWTADASLSKTQNIYPSGATWQQAMDYCTALYIGGRRGWRLPTGAELESLVDQTNSNPSLPTGHPFMNVQLGGYWSSSSYTGASGYAWYVRIDSSGVTNANQVSGLNVWCVRGGQ